MSLKGDGAKRRRVLEASVFGKAGVIILYLLRRRNESKDLNSFVWILLLSDYMKYALIGDFHGSDLSDLEASLGYINPDVLICTGDFDQTSTIHQFMDLERKYLTAGKQVIKVPGNHDHAILTDMGIVSGTIQMQGKNSHQFHEELNSDSVAKKYIDELVNSRNPRYTKNRVKTFLDKDKFGEDYQTIIMHGAYDGDLSSFPGYPTELEDLWTRLRTPDDHDRNFRVMGQKGYNVMIRGHDHEPSYVYEDSKKGIVEYEPVTDGSTIYRLFNHRKHTINPGALFEGEFAVIDTNIPGEDIPGLIYCHL